MTGECLGIIIQARLGSTRLPGKVLKPLAGVPMIDWIVDRLRRCVSECRVVVATSDLPQDDAIVRHVTAGGTDVYRGSESDVLQRYVDCAKAHGFTHVVRLTGDNPFVDPEEIDRLISFHLENDLDYSSLHPEFACELPIGLGGEMFSIEALCQSADLGLRAHHREHVNEYILENRSIFRCGAPDVPSDKCGLGMTFTIDTMADFARAEKFATDFMLAHRGERFITSNWLIQAAQKEIHARTK